MSRRLLLLLIAATLLGGLSCRQDAIDDQGPVGSFALTERHGLGVSDVDLRGKVWVASFVFTRCTGPCPQVTGTMARLQSELNLAGEEDLRLVTFTVDPERDQPKELQEYAERFQAHKERWLFLTGKKEQIHELILEGFKLSVAEKPKDDPTPGDDFAHSTRLVLVDRRGHIRGTFHGLPRSASAEDEKEFDAGLSRLRKHVAALLKERHR